MYKIIGADGNEYGPVTTEQVQQWIVEGRANAQTRVLPDGASAWVELGTLPEFAAALAAKRGPSLPPVPEDASFLPSPDMEGKVQGPAIAMIIAGALGIVMALASIAIVVAGVNLQSLLPATPGMEQSGELKLFSGGLGITMDVIRLVANIVIIIGAMKMKSMTNYSFAVTAAILTVIPCFACCCYGLPIGIWALVVLMNPQVRAAFD